MPSEATFPAYLDRLEGDTAVLLLGEAAADAVNLPRRYLPEGAAEGDHFEFRLTLEPERRKGVATEVASLMEALLGAPASPPPASPASPPPKTTKDTEDTKDTK